MTCWPRQQDDGVRANRSLDSFTRINWGSPSVDASTTWSYSLDVEVPRTSPAEWSTYRFNPQAKVTGSKWLTRTIADLAGTEAVEGDHITEAVQYRSLDRQLWG